MSIADVVGAAGLGLALGVITGMPIGVVNVAIVEAATRGERRFALQIALGAALADAVHAAIAFAGVGRIVPDAARKLMAIVAAGAVLGYAVLAMRRQRAFAPPPRRYGVVTGLLLTLPNPAALGAWIAVAATLWPAIDVSSALALAVGVGLGSALWFMLLARVIAALPAEHAVVRWLPRVALVLLVALAGAGLARALLG